ncbi:MAG TPA: hypothetical protein VIF82_17360 [Burkholderiaceae bacterium]|jgi:hypothetical protein
MTLTGSQHAARILRSPRVPQVRYSSTASKINNHPITLGGCLFLVEAAGISRSSRLQARIRFGSGEHARRNPAFAPRPADSISDAIIKIKKPSDEAGWFVNFGGAAGIE